MDRKENEISYILISLIRQYFVHFFISISFHIFFRFIYFLVFNYLRFLYQIFILIPFVSFSFPCTFTFLCIFLFPFTFLLISVFYLIISAVLGRHLLLILLIHSTRSGPFPHRNSYIQRAFLAGCPFAVSWQITSVSCQLSAGFMPAPCEADGRQMLIC